MILSKSGFQLVSMLLSLHLKYLLKPRKNSAQFTAKNILFLLIKPKKISARLLFNKYSLVPIRRHVPIYSHASRHGTCNGPYRSHISMLQNVQGRIQGMLCIFARQNPIISHTSKMCQDMKCTAPNKDHASGK